ncbi:hypothetical protein [Bacillus sp. OV322]|uniref:hypothetical protein n=1 Tax=Bacillus sp. OV322 TaxID=1882764 RepID=UPI00210ACB7D|nr:hypothetical protein [Bacillus sp. OV322]
MAVKNAPPDVYYLVDYSRKLNRQIAGSIWEGNDLCKELLGSQWDMILSQTEPVQAIPRL